MVGDIWKRRLDRVPHKEIFPVQAGIDLELEMWCIDPKFAFNRNVDSIH